MVSTDSGATFNDVPNATSASYSFTATFAQNGDEYKAVFTNSLGSATSTAATLTVQTVPTVTTQPSDQTVLAGATATFTAAASGSPAPSVQWMVSTNNGASFSDISGATSATYSVATTLGQNGDEYEAVFSNAAGSATTTAATLTVQAAPAVTTQPSDQTVTAGATATFTAAASGNPTPSVQWMVSTDSGATFNDVPNATSATYSFIAAFAQNGDEYEAVFSNSLGSATSTAATLTVETVPTVTTQPSDQTVLAGATATFTAAASGNPTPSVQWMVSTDSGASFNDISGATSPSYSLTPTIAQNGDEFEAVFTNAAGSATTTAVTLTVQAAPAVTTQPTAQTVVAGHTATFTAAASGNPTPSVQWMVSTDSGATFNDVPNATSATYSFTATFAQNGDEFEAVFTNSLGSATTTAATLTVETVPSVTTQPSDQTVTAGATATFTAAASGNPTPSVQWMVSTDSGASFSNISGATSTTYSVAPTIAQNGDEFEAVFSNAAGSATTTAVTLTVQAAPVVTTPPSDQTVVAGHTATFTAAASGNPTPSVQWMVSTDSGATFNDVPNATSATYSFTATFAQNGDEFEAVFSNSLGSATSTAATLTVQTVPTVTTQPSDQTVTAGGTATFTAAASGNPTPSVQWMVSTDSGATFNDISGATSPTYSLTPTIAQNGDEFEAVFTNAAGSATTTAATLTVQAAPAVTTQPSDQTVGDGTTATFTAAASGNPTPSVQWMVSTDSGATFNDISGATSPTYSFTAGVAQSGDEYEAVFTNSLGTATTTAATLTVDSITEQPADQVIGSGDTATFTATSSLPGDTVQWMVMASGGSGFTALSNGASSSGAVYSGVTTTTLTITAATAGLSGNQYEAVFTDAAGTFTLASDPATLTVGYSLSVDQSSYNLVTGQTASFTLTTTSAIADASPSETMNWQVIDVANGAFLTGSVAVTSTSQQVTGINIGSGSNFAGGKVQFGATLTDAAGNEGPLVVRYVTLNTTAPPAFTISADIPTIDDFSATNTGFTFSGAETNDAYAYTVTDSAGNTVTGSGTVGSAAQDVTGIDVSGLTEGQLTYSVTLTNSIGNPTTATTTATLSGPFTVTPDQGTFDDIASFTLGNAEVGATYDYTVTDNFGNTVTGSGSVIAATQDITGINLATLAAGEVTFSVTLTDALSNVSSAVTAQAAIDPTAPTALALLTSVFPADAAAGDTIALLQTPGPNATTGTYTYTLLSVDGSSDSTSFPFQIVNDQLEAAGPLTDSSYSIVVQSMDARGRDVPAGLHAHGALGRQHGSRHAQPNHQLAFSQPVHRTPASWPPAPPWAPWTRPPPAAASWARRLTTAWFPGPEATTMFCSRSSPSTVNRICKR